MILRRKKAEKATVKTLPQGNFGFFAVEGAEPEPAPEPEPEIIPEPEPEPEPDIVDEPRAEPRPTRLRLHLATGGFVAAIIASWGAGAVGVVHMIEAQSAAKDYSVVDARVMKSDTRDGNQNLEVLWAYSGNTQVSTTELVSYGSGDKYQEGDTVNLMYLPSKFDPNVAAPGSTSYISDQYTQAEVAGYRIWIAAFGVLGLLILLASVKVLKGMSSKVSRTETWG